MHTKARKVMIIGAGNVGASAAYALLNQSICEELILVDLNQQRAEATLRTSAMPRPICRG
jgi:L-lactate dehydrogenase